jgi:CDP-diacylglycerol---serine O-phosphatidyltransferase
MVEQQPSKLNTRVRFPSPAPSASADVSDGPAPVLLLPFISEFVSQIGAGDVHGRRFIAVANGGAAAANPCSCCVGPCACVERRTNTVSQFQTAGKPDTAKLAPAHPLLRALPNLVTLLALAAGMTSIKFAIEGAHSQAVGCILLAALLDGCDGRIARYVGTNSALGAQLDSLSDVICFGVAPALLMYFWGVNGFGVWGWVAVIVYVAATAFRLARFNVVAAEPNKPVWQAAFFQGVPSPAGAFLALQPLFLVGSGLVDREQGAKLALVWLVVVGALMVSMLPTFSGKLLGRLLRRAWLALMMLCISTGAIGFWFGLWPALAFGGLHVFNSIRGMAAQHFARPQLSSISARNHGVAASCGAFRIII